MRRSNDDWNGTEIKAAIKGCDEIKTRRKDKRYKVVNLVIKTTLKFL